ncbi:coiled-coil domain-containing protein 28A isoform X1 [Coccinella septempunctata]|uniref:coiled-coil domain-containing protein 28A isoform X1 n=1 Tax=Coccinella septempunctata TaxID=41139 RepID=UPI001D093989|nr:coiled-coil domain-containing protein 28A isoform X1 [Coccinella septempunctata]
MESRGETSELQQLVSSDVDGEYDDSITQDEGLSESKVVSPVRSNKISSSGNTSRSSINRSTGRNINTKIHYVNERKTNRDNIKNNNTARPRHPHKDNTVKHHCFISEVPDVRHMEKALLDLLSDFNSGKLRAFGSGCTMAQMTDIREQQEKLAKLHFDLSGTPDPSLSNSSIARSQNAMSELIQRLEQLSVSIEGLHTNSKT